MFSLTGAARPSRRLAEIPFEARFLLLSPPASQLSPAQAGPSVDSHFVSDTREFILSPAHAQPLSSSTTQRALRREGDGIMGLGCPPTAAQLLSSCLRSGVPIRTSFISPCENPATALPGPPQFCFLSSPCTSAAYRKINASVHFSRPLQAYISSCSFVFWSKTIINSNILTAVALEQETRS